MMGGEGLEVEGIVQVALSSTFLVETALVHIRAHGNKRKEVRTRESEREREKEKA